MEVRLPGMGDKSVPRLWEYAVILALTGLVLVAMLLLYGSQFMSAITPPTP